MITKPVEQAGYIYIYLSNESNINHNVYFDDLRITHTKSKILQEDHYYPFGMSISALSSSAPLSKPNHFKYGGKELQPDFNMDWYDYGARMYDPTIGRWNHVDPLTERYYEWSPYNYALNNPIRFVDPNGQNVEDEIKGTTVVTSTMDKFGKLHVTSTTITTTTSTAKDGTVTTTTSTSVATNIISNDPDVKTVRGDVTTTTTVSVDGEQVGDPTTTTSSQDDFGGDLSKLNEGTGFLENFRNENGMQFNEYLIEHGIEGLNTAFKGATLPFTGLLPGIIGKVGGAAELFGVPGSPSSGQKFASKKILSKDTPIIIDVSPISNDQTSPNLPQRRNPKEGAVGKGHRLLYDIVFGWWLDNN